VEDLTNAICASHFHFAVLITVVEFELKKHFRSCRRSITVLLKSVKVLWNSGCEIFSLGETLNRGKGISLKFYRVILPSKHTARPDRSREM
jgi:hypothetical protein